MTPFGFNPIRLYILSPSQFREISEEYAFDPRTSPSYSTWYGGVPEIYLQRTHLAPLKRELENLEKSK